MASSTRACWSSLHSQRASQYDGSGRSCTADTVSKGPGFPNKVLKVSSDGLVSVAVRVSSQQSPEMTTEIRLPIDRRYESRQ